MNKKEEVKKGLEKLDDLHTKLSEQVSSCWLKSRQILIELIPLMDQEDSDLGTAMKEYEEMKHKEATLRLLNTE